MPQHRFSDSACSLPCSSFRGFSICRVMAGARQRDTVRVRHANNKLKGVPIQTLARLRCLRRSIPRYLHWAVNGLHTYSNFRKDLYRSSDTRERPMRHNVVDRQGWHSRVAQKPHKGLWHSHLIELQARLSLMYAASAKSSSSRPRRSEERAQGCGHKGQQLP